MTRQPRRSPYEKYIMSLNIVNEMLSQHSLDTLMEKRYEYQQRLRHGPPPDNELKYFNKLYVKYNRNKRYIDEYENTLPDDFLPLTSFDICANCQRMQTIGYQHVNPSYQIEYFHIRSDSIVQKRKFKTIQAFTGARHCVYKLCNECKLYLDKAQPNNSFAVGWCSYIWSLLSNKDIHDKYGCFIWRFIPSEWRLWWLQMVKMRFPNVFVAIDLHNPSPAFKDKTTDIQTWNDDINSYLLSRLASSANKYLIPTISCPWGCSEFQHKVGNIPIDILFQRYLQKCSLQSFTNKHFHRKVFGVREDYICEEGDETRLFYNPAWKVMPSIAFVDGKGPVVLTCSEHNNGTPKRYIHTCHWQHNLPAKKPDQLCQVVLQPRILKPVQASKYSTSFRMLNQQGTFNGIDTCNAVTYGKFDFQSKLSSEAQARSVANRPDINAHLATLNKEHIISNYTEKGIRDFAIQFSQDIDYDKLTKGATFISLENCIMLQRELEKNSLSAYYDHGDTPQPIRKQFSRYWSQCIYPCQNMTKFGVIFPKIPTLNSSEYNTINIWTVAAIMCRVEVIWRSVCAVELYTSKWHGWLLVFLTKKCFNEGSLRQTKNDPFQYTFISDIPRLYNKVHKDYFCDYFNDLDDIFIFETNEENGNAGNIIQNLNVNFHNFKALIIVQRYQEAVMIEPMSEHLNLSECNFELRTMIGLQHLEQDRYDTILWSRHGGEKHCKWWFDTRHQERAIQVDDVDRNILTNTFINVFVKTENQDITKLRGEFLRSIGGQTHVQCGVHRVPLIASTERKNNCSECSRQDFMRCCTFNCQIFLCKRCFNDKQHNQTTYIFHNEQDTISNNETSHIETNADDNMSSSDLTISSTDRNSHQNIDTSLDDITDNLNDFVMNSIQPDILVEDFDDIDNDNHHQSNDENMITDQMVDFIPTTNAGDRAFEIVHETEYGGAFGNITISGSVLLNQCGTLLTRKKHQIKGSSRHHFFLQKLVASTHGSTIPLMYPEGVLFPSIHWCMAHDNCSILGCIPAPLLTEYSSCSKFASIHSHIRSRLTNPSCATSTDTRYIAHCYDILTNLTANHEDTRLILNRGLAYNNDTEDIGMRGKGDSALLESIDNKQMVRNLCFSQKFAPWDHFLTYTCNQRTHFGTAPIKTWIDDGFWKNYYPGFHELESDDQKEIEYAVIESSACALLRVWEETFLLFIDYLRKSPSSPFKSLNAIFARKEYQTSKGNLSHAHMMICLQWDEMSEEEKKYVNDLIRASIFDIVKPHEINHFINDGIFTHRDDVTTVYENAMKFLPHICNDSCLVKKSDGTFRCRKINNLMASPDNTKHMFLPLPNDYSVPCLRILDKIGLTNSLDIDTEGNVRTFKSKLPYFHPKRHVPPTNPTEDMNISPVEGYIFSVTKSMQNVQRLTGAGGCSKYVCKYIAKIDEQNYVIIEIDGEGRLVSKATFLHNTKISSSKQIQDNERKKHQNKPQGRCIAVLEMLHVMLKYPEIVTNLEFIKVSTMPLELRGGISLNFDANVQDSAYICSAVESFRRVSSNLNPSRLQTNSQNLTIDDIKLSKMSIDKVTQFGLRPPELRSIITKLGDYYRWFVIDKKKIPVILFPEKITTVLFDSCWIDCLQRQVRVRKKALPEILIWCIELGDYLDHEDNHNHRDKPHIREMIELFQIINTIVHSDSGEFTEEYCHFVNNELVYNDDEKEHLPIPVFSYIAPTMKTSFILHFMLSEGHFETEIDLLLHPSVKECLRYCKLIGPRDDEDSLIEYANNLTRKYIEEQVQFFPNTQRVIDYWIITAHEIFYKIVVDNDLPIDEMPAVQLSTLITEQEDEMKKLNDQLKSSLIDAALNEIGITTALCCNIPSKFELMNATLDAPVVWDPVSSYRRNPVQSQESYEEQRFAIKTCIDTINDYCNIMTSTSYTKNIGIRGIPGSGKTFCNLYCMLYIISLGLKCNATSMMCKRALQLGGIHVHQTWPIPTEKHLTPHRRAELALTRLLKDPIKMNFLRSLNVIFF